MNGHTNSSVYVNTTVATLHKQGVSNKMDTFQTDHTNARSQGLIYVTWSCLHKFVYSCPSLLLHLVTFMENGNNHDRKAMQSEEG